MADGVRGAHGGSLCRSPRGSGQASDDMYSPLGSHREQLPCAARPRSTACSSVLSRPLAAPLLSPRFSVWWEPCRRQPFRTGVFHLATCIEGPSLSSRGLTIHFSLLLSNIPLSGGTAVYLSISPGRTSRLLPCPVFHFRKLSLGLEEALSSRPFSRKTAFLVGRPHPSFLTFFFFNCVPQFCLFLVRKGN